MRILLIRPPRIKQAITLSDFMFSEPLGLEMIVEVLKKTHEIEILDMMVEKEELVSKIKSYQPDAIGLTSLCIDINMVLALCAQIKGIDNNIITIVGGTQAFLNPMAFMDENVDHIFEYTNKKNLEQFYSYLSNNKMEYMIDGIRSKKFNYITTGNKGRNEYILPDRTSTSKYRHEYSYFGYRPAAIMEFGLGCEKCCEFCLRWRIEGIKERLIDRDLIKEDLSNIIEPTIMLMDNDFLSSEEKIHSFIELIKELQINKNFIVYGSTKGVIEYERSLEIFVQYGLKAVLIGYETFSDSEMIAYDKKSTTSDNIKAAEILSKLGVDVWASFMAHPDWSKEDFKRFRKYIRSLHPQIASISPLTPFPNLPMYKKYENRLIYKKEDYEKWSFGHVMIQPINMSLKSYYYELLKTNLYVNLFINKKTEMINHFGIINILRITKGSLKAFYKYITLMLYANNQSQI